MPRATVRQALGHLLGQLVYAGALLLRGPLPQAGGTHARWRRHANHRGRRG